MSARVIPGLIAVPVCILSVLALASTSPRITRDFTFHYENVLGTSYEMRVLATDEAAAERANSAALNEIAREAKILSSWDGTSEFSRWSAVTHRRVKVSPELFDVLGLFDQWRLRTGGALDPSAETLVRLWQRSAAEGGRPTSEQILSALATIRNPHWALRQDGTAEHLDRAPLVLSSFTKSYILESANKASMETGVSGSLINIGGDLAVRGSLIQTVNIADPFHNEENQPALARINIHDLAVATSGSYRRGVEIAGVHYSHIVDPRTGLPADFITSATVIAPHAVVAGALATAFSILKPDESRSLAASIPGVEFLLVDKTGHQVASAGWGKFLAPLQARAVSPAPAATWDPAMELLIDLDIHQPAGFAKRPYLAVWVEDAAKFPVRTVALWYNRDRWLPELRAWYNSDQFRAVAENKQAENKQIASTVSSATRPAGKYGIVWDGKDNGGKLVKAGKYTLLVEASREHGPYQLMRAEVEVNGTPRQIPLTGNTDIATATLEYRRTPKQ